MEINKKPSFKITVYERPRSVIHLPNSEEQRRRTVQHRSEMALTWKRRKIKMGIRTNQRHTDIQTYR
jgi:hypothetical protein